MGISSGTYRVGQNIRNLLENRRESQEQPSAPDLGPLPGTKALVLLFPDLEFWFL